MITDLRKYHQKQLKKINKELKNNKQKLRVRKKTISNLFRYQGRDVKNRRQVDLSDFNNVLFLDKKRETLEVQGLATFEKIVDFTLFYGLAPLVTPELKHITIGGALVGIGIETNSYKYGFVHNSLMEADVLLSNGKVITCSKNKNTDLFKALPNSYGTLGYVLRAKIKLRGIKPYMMLKTKKFDDTKTLLSALKNAARNKKNDSVETLIYSNKRSYLTTVCQSNKPENLTSIYGSSVFYKKISKAGTFSLKTKEFLFRYDPEWFWNMPESNTFKIFRNIAPEKIRNSALYTHYTNISSKIPFLKIDNEKYEQLIQDWEVPFEKANRLLDFVFKTADLDGKPMMGAIIKIPTSSTLYPIKKNQYYFNLGSYSFIKRKKGQKNFDATKKIDDMCFRLDGIKMLYSSTFLSKKAFDNIYNGREYEKLKQKYDPDGLLPTLYEKAVRGN